MEASEPDFVCSVCKAVITAEQRVWCCYTGCNKMIHGTCYTQRCPSCDATNAADVTRGFDLVAARSEIIHLPSVTRCEDHSFIPQGSPFVRALEANQRTWNVDARRIKMMEGHLLMPRRFVALIDAQLAAVSSPGTRQ